ncbi:MAG TPA: helix-turn-helix transcriptional regulator, partial [Lacunisphaera sp.]|nr:helix-turn-helix transcriptional regulator [Lacunisphaera sp.]
EPECIDRLARSGLIVESRETWKLSAGTRPAAAQLAPWSQRQRLRLALATLCLRDARDLAIGAAHAQAVGDNALAARCWLARGAQSAAAGDTAAAWQALSSWLGQPGGIAADVPRFTAVLGRCLADPALAESICEPLEAALANPVWQRLRGFVARIAPLLADLLGNLGRPGDSAQVRLQAAAALRTEGDIKGAAGLLAAATATLAFAGQLTAARQAAVEAIATAEEAGEPAVIAEAHSTLGLLLGLQGDSAAGRKELETALDLALRHRLTSLAAAAYHRLGTVAEYASCYGDQQTALARAVAYCRRHDQTDIEKLCLGCLSFSLFRSGNWPRSRAVAGKILAEKNPLPVSRAVARGALGLLRVHRGELREGIALLEGSIADSRPLGFVTVEIFCRWGLAFADEQAGRIPSAAWNHRRALDLWRGTEDRHDGIPAMTAGALFFLDRDDPDSAAGFIAAVQTMAGATANPEARGAAALLAGGQLNRQNRPAEAAHAFSQALEAFASRDLMVERVPTLIRLAQAQAAAGDAAASRASLREARLRAGRLGARAWLAACDRAAKGPPKRTAATAAAAGTDWDSLSPRQRDVARLLCEGLTNKEIAARLGVAVRTVDMHVAHLLGRLQCRSRTEAAARLQRQIR